MTKRYLVTGGAGFIGSHVVDALLLRGDQVVVLDNFNDYYSPERKRRNLEEVGGAGEPALSLTVIAGDIRDQASVEKAFSEPLDAVIHLAAMAGVRTSIENPGLYYDVNVMGTLRLLERSVQEDSFPTFVFASTSSVYGASTRFPLREDDPCDRPLVPYSASKRAGEVMGHAFHNLYGLDFAALRFFTVYGPRGRPDMMAYKVAESITAGTPVPLYNGGDMFRDWTFISDIVSGVLAAADRPVGYEVVNLGRGEPVRLGDFVEVIQDVMGSEAVLEEAQMPQGDVPKTHADIQKASSLFDYEPHVSVEEGARFFINWYREATE